MGRDNVDAIRCNFDPPCYNVKMALSMSCLILWNILLIFSGSTLAFQSAEGENDQHINLNCFCSLPFAKQSVHQVMFETKCVTPNSCFCCLGLRVESDIYCLVIKLYFSNKIFTVHVNGYHLYSWFTNNVLLLFVISLRQK